MQHINYSFTSHKLFGLHPYQIKDIFNLEKVHRKATRFIKQDYSKYNSVTRMIHELGWKNLQDR